MEPKNMKVCDKRNRNISSKLHMISVSSNNVRHSVTKTFTTLHSASLHWLTLPFLSFKRHQISPHFPLIWLNKI